MGVRREPDRMQDQGVQQLAGADLGPAVVTLLRQLDNARQQPVEVNRQRGACANPRYLLSL